MVGFNFNKKTTKLYTQIIFLFFFIVGILSVKNYGISYDELEYRQQGFVVLNYLGKKFAPNTSKKIIEDRGLNYISIEKYFGDNPNNYKIHHTIYAFLEFIFFKDSDKYTVFKFRHYLNFVMSFCLVLILYKILRFNFNRTISIIGCLAFVLSPRIFANFFYNPNDIWSAFSLASCLYFLLKLIKKNDIKYIFLFSAALVFAINIRYVNIYIYPLFFLFLVFNHIKNRPLLIKNIFFQIISFVSFLYLVTPDLWINPSQILLKIFGQSTFNVHNPKIMFDGKLIHSNNLPWYYLIKWFGITTPIVILVLGALGIIFSLYKTSIREIVKKKVILSQCNFILILLLFVPIFAFTILQPALFNGWRHFYFIYIFYIYFFCYALYTISLINFNNSVKKIILLFIFILSIIQIPWMIKNHPYQNVYFNFLAKNNAKKFELDYWGLSNLESLRYLINNEFSNFPITVSSFNDRSRIDFAYLMLSEIEKRKIKLGKFNDKRTQFFISNINNGLNISDYESLGLIVYKEFMIDGTVINKILKRDE